MRAYRLREPRTIDYVPAYGGCRSWIDLQEPISLEGMQPALPDAQFERLAGEIRSIVAGALVAS